MFLEMFSQWQTCPVCLKCSTWNISSFAWSAWRLFTSVPAGDWSIWLFSLWRKLRQRGRPAIESERKNISTWYNFLNSWSNHTKLLDCDDYIAVLWIWKLERKCNFVAEKLEFEYLPCTNPMGFFRCTPFLQRRLVSKYTEWISRRRYPTKQIYHLLVQSEQV